MISGPLLSYRDFRETGPRPFARSGHMVRNKLYMLERKYNNALGFPKQRNSCQSCPTFLCFESLTALFESQHNLFRTMIQQLWFTNDSTCDASYIHHRTRWKRGPRNELRISRSFRTPSVQSMHNFTFLPKPFVKIFSLLPPARCLRIEDEVFFRDLKKTRVVLRTVDLTGRSRDQRRTLVTVSMIARFSDGQMKYNS